MTTTSALREAVFPVGYAEERVSTFLSTNTAVALEFLGSLAPTTLIAGNNEPSWSTVSTGWIFSSLTDTSVRLTSNNSVPAFFSSGSFDPSNLLQIDTTVSNPPVYVRVRMRRVIEGDESWLGKLFFIEGTGSASETKRQFALEPDWSKGWVTVVWDMTTPESGSWVGLADIGRLRIDFLQSGSSFGTVYDIASIVIDNGIPPTTLTLPFTLHNTGDLLLTALNVSTQVQTPLILDTDYSVTAGSAPSLTLLSALSNGKELVARRLSSPRNDLSLTGTTLPIPETEETFDRFANYHADLLGELDRCVKLSDGELTPSSQGKIAIPEDRKGNFLKYDETTGELTHSPKLDGVPGPQGLQGDGARVTQLPADTGGSAAASTVQIVGTGLISTSRSGDTITIASADISGIDQCVADVGGSTMGSAVTLSGDTLTNTTRTADTITINSTSGATHAAGSVPNPALDFSTERRLLSTTGLVNFTAPYEAEVMDWPSTYRSIEVEFFEVLPVSDALFTAWLWDGTNNTFNQTDEGAFVETDDIEFLLGYLGTSGGNALSAGAGTPGLAGFWVSTTQPTTFGTTGSIKLTYVGNGMVVSKQRSQRVSHQVTGAGGITYRSTNELHWAQRVPLSAGVTHDGLNFGCYAGAPLTNFSGSFNIWGYPL
jgi:hypothetical protein